MKIKNCRVCSSKKLLKAYSLGKLKLTGHFLQNKNSVIASGDLTMLLCDNCSLLQLENSFDSKIMYGNNYGYRSSLNNHMVNHLKNKSVNLIKKYNILKNEAVIDIGSNDGTFLKNFNNKILIGIDPTIKKFGKFYRKDIIQIDDFFSLDLIKKKLKNKKVKLITSISMFYDLENPLKFAEEIYEALDKNGVWHFEQSYMPSMIRSYSYDTICHEHLEYYSLKSLKYILDKVGFKIIDLEFNDINGGSFALTVAKEKSKFADYKKITDWLLKKEDLNRYNTLSKQKEFFKDVEKHKILLKNLLLNIKDMKKTVVGYGASTKGNVILQYCGINENLIKCIADVNEFKHYKYTPGSKIKIIPENQARALNPDFFLVLPWHFKSFILNKEKKFIQNGGKFIFPLPEIEIV
jgi:hypothetical protein